MRRPASSAARKAKAHPHRLPTERTGSRDFSDGAKKVGDRARQPISHAGFGLDQKSTGLGQTCGFVGHGTAGKQTGLRAMALDKKCLAVQKEEGF